MLENQHRSATQPLTFGGIARFAYARAGRVWFVSFLVAAICAGVVIWFLARCVTPQITQAIENLPPVSQIRDGQLIWPGTNVIHLAEGPWLSISVEPLDQTSSSTSDFDLKLASRELRLRSLLGYSALPYPRGWVLELKKDDLLPRWGAWKPMVLAVVGVATVLGLLITWWLLALLYTPLVRFISYYADRDVTVRAVIKMNMAALLPAAIFMSAGILLYSMMELSLPALLVIGGLHFLVQLFYLLCVPFALPKVPEAPVLNPFKSAQEKEAARRKARRNPFKVAAD
jgi:hypothetical protein